MQQPPGAYSPDPQGQWQQPQMPPQQPSFPPQQYQPPAPEPEKKSNKRLWLILAALVILLALFIGVASLVQSPKQTATVQSTNLTQQSTTNPALQPTLQAAKDLSATHGTPHLGGPVSDFIGTYGKPDAHSTIQQRYITLHFLPSPSGVDGLIVATFHHTPVDLAANITVQAQNGNTQGSSMGWAVSDAKTKCMTFAPSDARLVKEYDYGNNIGFDLVYTSAQLAAEFPASAFTDTQQKHVPAGTFDIQYLYALDGKHISLCDLAIGAQQTTYNYGRNH